jgi:hypothetical protein
MQGNLQWRRGARPHLIGSFSEARLAGAIALTIVLTNAPCMAHAQESNQDLAAPKAQSAQQVEAAAKTPSKPNAANDRIGASDNVSDLEAIIVTGIRASLMSAQSLKQNADQIIDSVTATDIDALPDRSVTETLQRIGSASVDHFLAGDGPNHPATEDSGVLIRRLPYAGSLLNDRDSFSANNGRALGLQDVPTDAALGRSRAQGARGDVIAREIGKNRI